MATIKTNQVGNSYCPQMYVEYSVSSYDAVSDTISYTAKYVTHGYKASTNGKGRAWSVTINGTKVKSGSFNINGKSTTTLGSGTIKVAKTHSDKQVPVKCSFNLDVTWHGKYAGTVTASGSVFTGIKYNYAVSYNANGGSGAPGNQTKWHGENLTLSGTKPTRTGHNFAGWATSAGGAVAYQPGSTYTGNTPLTLYAKWTPYTYTVSYNANGGSGAPGNQTKTYGQNLTLSSTRPTRTNYNFKGWATSANGSVAYQPGSTYTSNSALTLYAVWELAWLEPRITNLIATRCNSAGTLSDDGTYAKVTFNWATDRTVSSIKVLCNGVTSTPSGSGTSGSVSVVVGANALSTEKSYTVRATVTDQVGSAWRETSVSAINYILDFTPNGSVAIGEPAYNGEKEFKIASNVKTSLYGPVHGHTESGYFSNGAWHYRMLAKSRSTIGDVGLYGAVRVFGHIGGFGMDPIDVSVRVRDASATTVTVNSGVETQWNNASCSTLMFIIGTDNYLYVYIAAKNYYAYNIRFEGTGFNIIKTEWSSSRIGGVVIFDSGIKKTDQFGGYPAKYEYLNGYPGFALPDKTRSEWVRTTYNGLIPYQSGGASALGTESWPFNATYTNNLHVHNNNLYWDTTGGLRGRVKKLLWSGTWSSGNITVSEAPYYNAFLFQLEGTVTCIAAFKSGENKYLRGIAVQATGPKNMFLYGVNVSTSGTSFNNDAHPSPAFNIRMSNSGVWEKLVNFNITRIYGLL